MFVELFEVVLGHTVGVKSLVALLVAKSDELELAATSGGDIVLVVDWVHAVDTLGCGDIYKAAKIIIKMLEESI